MREIELLYHRHQQRRLLVVLGLVVLLVVASCLLVTAGDVGSVKTLITGLLSYRSERLHLVVWQIRLPRLVGAILGGCSLALSGAVLQSVLRNPLASPTTLGISQGAAFGAALGIVLSGDVTGTFAAFQGRWSVGGNWGMVTAFSFIFSLVTTVVVILLAQMRRAGREAIILAGVALGSLFMAGTTFLQYFADETQLAMIVHWTFGDLARASWSDLAKVAAVTLFSSAYFVVNRMKYNALLAGDEVAQSLGVNVRRLRLVTMFMASLATAVPVAFFGILGFVGLIAPHIGRYLVGSDHRFLLVVTALVGPVVLMLADLAGQLILAPVALPAGVVTSFLGTPVFLLILFGREGV